MTRQRRKSEIRRQQILEAAIAVFAERGFHSSRVSDIAQRAGVAYGLVYHYFVNKEEILRTIFLERWAVVLKVIEDAVSDEERSVYDRLLSILSFLIDIYKQNAALVDVIILELIHSPEFMREEVLRGFQRAIDGVAEIVRQGKHRGEIRSDADTRLVAVYFLGGMEVTFNAVALKLIDIDSMPTQQFAAHMVDHLLRGAGSGA